MAKEKIKNALPTINIKTKKKPSKKKVEAKKNNKVKKINRITPKGKEKNKKIDSLGRDRSSVAKKTAKQKKTFISKLEDSFGIVTSACAKIKISNSTFYQWYNKDPEFKKEIDEIQNQFDIIVEDKIKQGIIRDDGAMIRFYASTRIKKYQPKLGLGGGEDLEPIQLMITTRKTKREEGEDED